MGGHQGHIMVGNKNGKMTENPSRQPAKQPTSEPASKANAIQISHQAAKQPTKPTSQAGRHTNIGNEYNSSQPLKCRTTKHCGSSSVRVHCIVNNKCSQVQIQLAKRQNAWEDIERTWETQAGNYEKVKWPRWIAWITLLCKTIPLVVFVIEAHAFMSKHPANSQYTWIPKRLLVSKDSSCPMYLCLL